MLLEALVEAAKVSEEDLEKDSEQPPPADTDNISPDSPLASDPKPPGPSATSKVSGDPEIAITGTGYQSPGCHILTRHCGKNETFSTDKFDIELPALEKMSMDDLHASYITRLSTSRDMESRLVSLMRKKHEVPFLYFTFT